jgi:1-phosphofructokinase
VVADLSGEQLRAVEKAGVTVLKVSHQELLRDGRADADHPAELIRAMRGFAHERTRAIVVSRADQPSLAMLDDELYEVRTPTLEAADPHGAGDSMTAGIAAALARGDALDVALRYGAAAGALNVTRHGLGTGSREGVDRLARRVELRRLPDPGESATETSVDHVSPGDLAQRTTTP